MRAAGRGFFVGTLGLVALYTLLQPQSATAAAAGGGVIVGFLRRLLSADVAGVPQRGPKGPNVVIGGTGAATKPPVVLPGPALTPGWN
jgi:hypothetical protein